MFLDRLFKFRMIAPHLWSNFAILSNEALLEAAAATNEHSFHIKNTFSKKNRGY